MQSRSKQIEAFRKVLKLAKTDLYKDNEINEALANDVVDALSLIGKEKLSELSHEVYELLNTPDWIIRETVVTTLGSITCLHLPEFKEVAYKMWLEDTHENVRQAALDAWASYYYNTRNPQVLKILYKILIDETYPVYHRFTAMMEIFFVSQEPSNFYDPYNSKHFYMVSSHEEFNGMVDWNEIKAIMKKYAPDALS